ncbi:hypothetical protein, partial [Desulfamplus magnetovallimortis]|uniref:hypothetical protein n=1 Tax=Desulfamplus magnetovallimortis TaxID=1246637 RepID=UPI001C97267F
MITLPLSKYATSFLNNFRFYRKTALIIMAILFIPIQVFAIYDQIAFDVAVKDNTVTFAFTPDYKQDLDRDGNLVQRVAPDIKPFYNLYVVALNTDGFYFINNNQGILEKEKFDPAVEPSPLITRSSHGLETVMGSFNVAELNNTYFFAGSGSSLLDLLTTGSFVQLYAGYIPAIPQPERQWTIMVYMVGSDLEGDSGTKTRNASNDIMQMIAGSAGLNSNTVNIVITTGGSKRNGWQTVKRSFIHNGTLHAMADMGDLNMGAPETLSDFVSWSK